MKKSELSVKNLFAQIGEKQILKGITFTAKSGEVHAIMGPNGGGKSTLAYALMGHPSYECSAPKGKAEIDSKNILSLNPEERARLGLFLAFQSPIAIPGVTVVNLLRTAYQEIYSTNEIPQKEGLNPALSRRWKVNNITLSDFTKQLKEYAKILKMDQHFFDRGIHDGFSGGERKKLEMLQALVLKPKFAFFDEIDTGLDVDALKNVASGINKLVDNNTGVIVITHYQRILKYISPDFVHILVDGKIVKSGDAKLAEDVEKNGYSKYVTTKSNN